jgi:hypothetical protein
MRYKLWFVVLLPVFCSFLYGADVPSEWDSFCQKCHSDRPGSILYNPSSKAHSVKSVSCVACHPNKGTAGHVKQSEESFKSLFKNMTLPPDVAPRQSSAMTSDDCLRCHPYIREVDVIADKKLSKEVLPIKLRAAHGQHWDFRAFGQEQQDKLNVLSKKQSESSITKAEMDQGDYLLLAQNMQCARCHSGGGRGNRGGFNPNANSAAGGMMECASCHVGLRTASHPGNTSSSPSAVSCDRCHSGRRHQRIVLFPANRGTQSNCQRCHPDYSPDKLTGVRPEQFSHKSVGTPMPGPR